MHTLADLMINPAWENINKTGQLNKHISKRRWLIQTNSLSLLSRRITQANFSGANMSVCFSTVVFLTCATKEIITIRMKNFWNLVMLKYAIFEHFKLNYVWLEMPKSQKVWHICSRKTSSRIRPNDFFFTNACTVPGLYLRFQLK